MNRVKRTVSVIILASVTLLAACGGDDPGKAFNGAERSEQSP